MTTNPRLTAYQVAMRITPEPWNITEVLQRCEIIRRFIDDQDPELRIAVLNTLTTALGVGPDRPAFRRLEASALPPADRLVEHARRVLRYVQQQ